MVKKLHRLTSNGLLRPKKASTISLSRRCRARGESKMLWARMVSYVTGTVNQELLLRNEYLGAENRILRRQIKGRLLLSEGEKATLAEIAQRLGRKALEELAAVAKPGYAGGLVPRDHRQQIRRIEVSPTSRSTANG